VGSSKLVKRHFHSFGPVLFEYAWYCTRSFALRESKHILKVL
jgi:hypothetical protein